MLKKKKSNSSFQAGKDCLIKKQKEQTIMGRPVILSCVNIKNPAQQQTTDL